LRRAPFEEDRRRPPQFHHGDRGGRAGRPKSKAAATGRSLRRIRADFSASSFRHRRGARRVPRRLGNRPRAGSSATRTRRRSRRHRMAGFGRRARGDMYRANTQSRSRHQPGTSPRAPVASALLRRRALWLSFDKPLTRHRRHGDLVDSDEVLGILRSVKSVEVVNPSCARTEKGVVKVSERSKSELRRQTR